MSENIENSNRRATIIDGPKKDLAEVILKEIGGTFKKYQIINYILFCLPFALSGSFGVNYVFTTLKVEYR